MGAKPKYTKTELLILLKKELEINPKITISEFKKRKDLPTPDVYIKNFGSWNEAKKLTGVTKIKVSSYTDDELLEILKTELEKNPNVASSYFKNENNLPNGRIYHKRFGSWNKAKEIVGATNFKVYHYTDEEMIDILRQELIKNPKLTQLELDKVDGIPHSRTYNTRFGWNKAKELTGVEYHNTKQKQTDDELLEILKNELNKNSDLTIVEFNKIENMPSYSTYIDRFGSWNEAKVLCGSESVFSRKYTDEELLNYLREYNDNFGFPETTCFNNSKTPCFQLYYLKFGSWENALNLAGIKIPKEKQKYYNARNYTKEEILEEVQMLIDSYLEDNIFLPPKSYFSNKSKKISDATLNKMFGGIYETYKLLGYNYKEFNKKRLEEDMIEKYKEIKDILGHVPSTNEIKEYSKNNPGYYASTTYRRHFGSITDLQLDLFGKTTEIKRSMITPNGTRCLSSLEYIVAVILEDNNYSFDKDVLYRKFITKLKSKHSVDFVLYNNDKYYFIEVFGLMNYEDYAEKTAWKIQLCKDNNIPLLELYPKDISMSQFDELASTIANFVSQ